MAIGRCVQIEADLCKAGIRTFLPLPGFCSYMKIRFGAISALVLTKVPKPASAATRSNPRPAPQLTSTPQPAKRPRTSPALAGLSLAAVTNANLRCYLLNALREIDPKEAARFDPPRPASHEHTVH